LLAITAGGAVDGERRAANGHVALPRRLRALEIGAGRTAMALPSACPNALEADGAADRRTHDELEVDYHGARVVAAGLDHQSPATACAHAMVRERPQTSPAAAQ
jgi:hypothetical protein